MFRSVLMWCSTLVIHCQTSCDVSLLQRHEVDAVKVGHWNTSQLKTTPKALTVTDRSLSPQQQEESICLLSQSGRDGIGHQLHGKLSCMAMASFLGIKYVHKPFFTMAHVENREKTAAFFEKFFGLGNQFPTIREPVQQLISKFSVWHCEEKGWLRQIELGERKCEGPNKVRAPDSCWDRMYCHGYMESGHFYKLVPTLHAAYHSTPKPEAHWAEGLSQQSWGPKVAVHIRQGDSPFKMNLDWYVRQIHEVRQRFLQQDPKHPPLFRIQTDGTDAKLLHVAPELGAHDIVIDAAPTTSLALAIHRMITADALIMSRSSLSMSMALIGNQSTIIYPDCFDYAYSFKPLPHWIRAPCK